ncbi:hypothetical protein [Paenibacillus sp. BIC5C1]|uniref:hypothetical protein n=1 Tax=Paenibacillus sp. BIC5C1 TaxID=3078263 RepID=UPI0028E481EA|nr:hypothetical protein [Paenibacillus sp. BIC5C1]
MNLTFFKKFSLLIGAFVLAFSLTSNQSVKAAVDYSGGLLDGKQLYNSGGFTEGNLIGTEVTDNNESTIFTIEKGTPGSTGTLDHIYYDFTTPQSILSYRLKADRATNVILELLDVNENYLGKISVNVTDGSLIVLPEAITGVSKVSLVNTNNSLPLKVSEFNVYSPIPDPEPEQPSVNRAIFVVTMTTGLEKEYDLSMKEVNDFIDWYEAKQAGSGKASYAIDKHDNNKGPFKSRKDYILFDRVLTFEVSEY